MEKVTSSIIGAAGEHYVAAMLSCCGLVVAMPRGGVPSTDLIVTRHVGGRAISIQVKTGTHSYENRKRKPEESYYHWDTGFKALDLSSDSHWYAYVFLNGWPSEQGALPQVFFVPSRVVAACLRKQREEGQKKRMFFWMYEGEAEGYRDLKGYQKLIEHLQR